MNDDIAQLGVRSHIVCDETSRAILNVEWAVLPPFNSKEAVPLEATANAMPSAQRMESSNALKRKEVLPVPPGPSTKKTREVAK